MATAQVWSTKGEFEGEPTLKDFVLTEENLPPLKDNEILIEALYLSLDPYFRLVSVRDGLPGEQVARIIDSKAPGFPVGGLVTAPVGWRSKSVVDVNKTRSYGIKVELIQEIPGLSPSLWLGAAGMPGVTAYLSFLQYCNPKKGEIIVVSTAAGAVGSIVGQLAKIEGLTVIGLTSTKEKCEYIKELGFDHAINYKQEDLSATLDKIAPGGVDIYYDNVGGDISDAVYAKLRNNGRVLICGQISTYNTRVPKVTNWNMQILYKQLRVQGFIASSEENIKQFATARNALISLIKEGKLIAKEHITKGFENMPKAFLELFSSANLGKAILKV